ncbi:MAG: site-specific integrase [Oscillospiraceae bacterium]|nr:site-specific integrase [Oscillospiraceae bacterium]MBR6836714.1 site-specific integrase [Oscillospiraceae bacterium]
MEKEKKNVNELQNISDVIGYMKSIGKTDVPKLDRGEVRVSDWAEYWLDNFCENLKVNTSVYYRSVVKHHINRVIGDIILSDLSEEDVQLFINSLILGVGTHQPLSPKSVKNIHGVLHKCLDVALRRKYIDVNPAARISLPKIPCRSTNVMSNAVLGCFLREVKGKEKENFYRCALFTGLRLSELIGLTWDCIDFDKGTIHVYRQLVKDRTSNEYVFTSLKNNRSRTIYPADIVMDILLKIRKTVPDTPEHFVFVSTQSGTHYTVAAVYSSFKRTVRRIGYPNLRVHDLRHTYAVLSLLAGDDIKTLQCNMGHFSASFTLDVYGHFTDDMKRNSSKKMTAFISENFPDESSQ